MARVPWLERQVGLDRLAVWHRWNGFAAVWLLSGTRCSRRSATRRAATCRWSRRPATWSTHYPDVLMAIVGFGLLVAVGVSSARAARPQAPAGDVVLDPSLRVSRLLRCRSRINSPWEPTSAATASRGLVGRALRRRVRVDARVAGRCGHCGSTPGTRCACARSRREAPGVVSIYLERPPARRARRAIRPVLPLALPHARSLVEGASVLAVGGPEQTQPAHHGEGSRRRHA